MQRIYLILRNNNQTGPFTIDELLQQQLKPSDMLWIEGQSTVWAYLSELELKLPDHEPMSVKEKKISIPKSLLPADEIETRAEELRKKAMSFSPQHYNLNLSPLRNNETYLHKTGNSTEETIRIVDHREKKHSVLKEFIIPCFLIILFALGVYKGRSIFNEKRNAPDQERGIVISSDEHNALKKTTVTLKANTDTTVRATNAIQMPIKKSKNLLPKKYKEQVNKGIDSIKPITIPVANNKEDAVLVAQLPAEDLQKKQIVAPDQKQIVIEQPVEKKKTLVQAIKGLFRKKKKEDVSKDE